MEAVLKDKRFAHVAKDPRFRKMPKGDRKVKIDKRFKDMFEDKKFKLKYTVDARGRPVNLSSNENLKKFYELSDNEDSDDSSDESDDQEESRDTVKERIHKNDSENSSEEETDDSDDGNKGLSNKHETKSDSESSEEELNSILTLPDKKKSVRKKEKQKKKKESKLTKLPESSIKEGTNISKKTKSGTKQERKKVEEKGKSKKVKEIGSGDDEGKMPMVNTKEAKVKKKKEQTSDKILDKEIDYARGEGDLESSSSDDDDDSDDSLGKDPTDFDHKWHEQDENIVEVSDVTRRLAVCNMDWDRIKAKDIFFLLSSFKPGQGLVKSVKVYPSEFGKERMEQERLEGPKELKELKTTDKGEEEEELDKDGTRFQTEKLRQYQLLRLKYYYAVVECDSVETADYIYRECDGKEYESSSTKVDLRFIPDDMEFEDEPNTSCTDVPVDYKPNFFFNTALSQSKVDLTWDETDRDRTHKISKQFEPKGEDLEDDDLNAYLASSSDEEGVDYGNLVQQSDSDDDDDDDAKDDGEEEGEEEKEDKQISKYKLLLQEIDQEEKKKKDLDVQMEITWEPGLKEATEEMVKNKKKETKSQTPWEDYLTRKKEKKKQKQLDKKHQRLLQQTALEPREEEEGEEEDDSDKQFEDDRAFSDDDLPAGVDFDDPFFAEESTATEKSQKADNKKKKKKKKRMNEETEEDQKEKEALALLVMGEEEEEKKHFRLKNLVDSDKKTKKKKKRDKGDQPLPRKEDDFKVNVQDPRFSAMYESHLFNMDPSAPEFRKTKGTEAIVEEKLKRSKKKGNKQNTRVDSSSAKKRKLDEGAVGKDESLASLVNSVKMKTKHFKSSKSKV